MLFQRREIPWEVVDSKTVDPVPIYFEDEGLELVVLKQGNVRRKYVLDVKPDASLNSELRKALIFSQEQLLQEIRENGYNVLLSESWQITVLRRATLYRIEVEYTGRPARATNEGPQRDPPYMAVLEDVMTPEQASDPSSISLVTKASSRLLQPPLGRPVSFLIKH